MAAATDALAVVLERARARGLLGAVPVQDHLRHAEGFLAAADEIAATDDPALWEGPAVDLGSGGGLPGLALAVWRPSTSWQLLDSRSRACLHLEEAVAELDLVGRVEVVHERAEVIGRSAARGQARLVTARAFAGPAVTAECAAPLLAAGGHLIVSNPPGGAAATARSATWPADALAELGLTDRRVMAAAGATFTCLRQDRPCPERFPRRTGVPAKRPLF